MGGDAADVDGADVDAADVDAEDEVEAGGSAAGTELATGSTAGSLSGQSIVIEPTTAAVSLAWSTVLAVDSCVTGVGGAVGVSGPIVVMAVVGSLASVAGVSVDDPDPAGAATGKAQALVPASTEIPTAATITRLAAPGAIRRSSDRPNRPGAPGSRAASAAQLTATPHASTAHTSRPAETRIAC